MYREYPRCRVCVQLHVPSALRLRLFAVQDGLGDLAAISHGNSPAVPSVPSVTNQRKGRLFVCTQDFYAKLGLFTERAPMMMGRAGGRALGVENL